MSYNRTGIVYKNDVYAHGSRVNREGMVSRTKDCMICNNPISASETCFYIFSARGTSAAQSRYVHIACEPQCHIAPLTRARSICRICDKEGNLDGCFKIPGRNIYYHQACLPNASKEITSEEVVKEKMKKRAEGRLKRGEIFYDVRVLPEYTELVLERQEGNYPHRTDDCIRITLKPLDGRLVQASFNWEIHLFRHGYWVCEAEIRINCDSYLKNSTYAKNAPKDFADRLLKVQKDLQRHYDARGRVIGERIDSDYKLRFVLNYGTSLEGAVDDPIR